MPEITKNAERLRFPNGTGPSSVALANGRKEGLVFSFEKEVLGTH